MTRGSIVGLVGLAACSFGSGEPEPVAGEPITEIPALTNIYGCGDIAMYAASADGTVRVRFAAEDLVAAAYAGTTSVSATLPDAAFDLALEQGRALDEGGCTDLVEYVNGQPVVQVDLTWEVVSGSLALEITPNAAEYQECNADADAVLTLDQVVFEAPTGEQLTLEHLEMPANVGWCAG